MISEWKYERLLNPLTYNSRATIQWAKRDARQNIQWHPTKDKQILITTAFKIQAKDITTQKVVDIAEVPEPVSEWIFSPKATRILLSSDAQRVNLKIHQYLK